VHTGHIALIPGDEKIPIRDPNTGAIFESDGYLIEAQTLRGLSGSPVFARRSIRAAPLDAKRARSGDDLPSGYGPLFLLGVYSGAWDAAPGSILAADRNLSGGVRVPVGMGVVVPGQRIIEIITQKAVEPRKRRIYDWGGGRVVES
jgi:hypothetical protein